MSEMTATRKAATIVAGCILWASAAWLLWRTRVPDVRLPHVSAQSLFSAHELARAARHERFLDWLWVAETVVQLLVLALAATRAPRFVSRLRGPRVVRAALAAV